MGSAGSQPGRSPRDDRDEVVRLLDACAELRLDDGQAALGLVAEARETCRRLPLSPDREGLALRVQAAEAACCRSLGRDDEALGLARDVLSSAGDRHGHAAAAAHVVLAATHLARGEHQPAREHLGHGLELIEREDLEDPPLEANLHSQLGLSFQATGDWGKARTELTHALRLLPTDSLAAGLVGSALGSVLARLGDHAGALQLYRQALTTQREAGHWRGAAWSLHNIATALASLGRFDDALATNDECLEHLEGRGERAKVEDAQLIGMAWLRRGRVQQEIGDVTAARESLERALALSGPNPARIGSLLSHLGDCSRAEGDDATARRHYHESLEHLADTEGQLRASPLLGLARVECSRGRHVEARAALDEALGLAESSGDPQLQREALEAAVDIHEGAGRHADVIAALRRLREVERQESTMATAARVEHLRLGYELERARHRESVLAESRQQLEGRVHERTRELEESNRRLETEAAERARAEAERADAEEQLRQSRALEAVGRLAGRVAHDINNVLVVIVGACELAREDAEDPEGEAALSMALDAVDRATDLTSRLLAFCRSKPLERHVLSIDELIVDHADALRGLLPETVHLELDLQAADARVRGDAERLVEALESLIANAGEALAGHGSVTLTTRAPEDVRQLRGHELVKVRVEDDGPGIDSEVLPHVLEPFFSTKGKGLGTGLGLSTAYGIVRQHSGQLRIRSEVGVGTQVDLLIPRTEDPETSLPIGRRRPPPRSGQRRRMLLVEDEDAVRSVVGRTLRRAGHEVVEAVDGRQALAVLRERHEEFELIVSDVVMPGMSGLELLHEIRRCWPSLKVLFASGQTGSEPGFDDLPDDCGFLAKPFRAEELEAAIERLLAPPRDRPSA
ncbi:MAG: tetratricopeptide repeat protein [Acidobacteriota bacterium]